MARDLIVELAIAGGLKNVLQGLQFMEQATARSTGLRIGSRR